MRGPKGLIFAFLCVAVAFGAWTFALRGDPARPELQNPQKHDLPRPTLPTPDVTTTTLDPYRNLRIAVADYCRSTGRGRGWVDANGDAHCEAPAGG